MMLALHLTMTGPVDRAAAVTAEHQPRPIRIEARLFDKDMSEAGRLDAIIRPDGWTVSAAERANRCGVRPVAWLPLLKDWNEAASHLVAFDIPETDWAVRVCRSISRGAPEWMREMQIAHDVAQDSRELLGREPGGITLAEATTSLLGAPVPGLEGVLALYQHESVQQLRRAAA
ncbi:hypothetical protein ATO13_22226 [Stappia sp. 22II-S9-Z10]|nr:hypothetical protein ATO13_22226 [Stappia sp. 22II-S9-Z10]